MIAFVVRCGDDVDTIGAMADALWGAARAMARLPQNHLRQREPRVLIVAGELYKAHRRQHRSTVPPDVP